MSAPAAPASEASSFPRIPALDGLRALAVGAVIGYHCGVPGVFEAGFLGVDVFFALSGFLISGLLLREFETRGQVGFAGFYLRRALRLLPAVLGLLGVAAWVTPWLLPEALPRLVHDMPAAAFYLANWSQIYAGQSYFERFGAPPLLQHLWSLAVEEQFYILWPVLFVGALRAGGRGLAAGLALAGALLSSGWMAWVYQFVVDGGDPSRAYLGSDTHLMGLLSGAALACLWRPGQVAPAPWLRGLLRAGGLLGLGGLAALMLGLNEGSEGLYLGGFWLAGGLSCLLIACLSLPPAGGPRPLAALLESAPLQWVGTRSYSLYLWHWPIFVWLQVSPATPPGVLALGLGMSALCAEFSYRLIERPFRRLAWDGGLQVRVLAPLLGVLGCAGVSLAALLPGWSPEGGGSGVAVAGTLTPLPAPVVHPAPAEAPASAPQPAAPAESTASLAASDPTPAPLPPELAALPRLPAGTRITAVGDSVLLGARETLKRSMPGIAVDAQVGRQPVQGIKVLRELRASASLSDTVVLHLGTNGYLSETTLRTLLDELQDRRRVIVLNVHANRRWTEPNNALLKRIGPAYANVRLIDWEALSARNPDYFVADGVHLTTRGIAAFAREIITSAGPATPPPAAVAAGAKPAPAPQKLALLELPGRPPRLADKPERSDKAEHPGHERPERPERPERMEGAAPSADAPREPGPPPAPAQE